MSTFVLIHGAWHGGWCWREVAAGLRAQGHAVFTPSLSGNGEHQHQNHAGISLETHVRDVLGVFASEDIDQAVLVGHSYGGMVVSCVADRIPDRIARLVYLDAFVPEHGESLADVIARSVPAEAGAAYTAHFHAAAKNEGLVPPIPGEMFGQTPQTTQRMQRFCNAQSLATLTSPALLDGKAAKLPKHYVLAMDWQPSPFPAQAERAEQAGWPVTRLRGGHCLMMDAPEQTVAALVQA